MPPPTTTIGWGNGGCELVVIEMEGSPERGPGGKSRGPARGGEWRLGYTFAFLRRGNICAGRGSVAQLVEQRTENPCVGGSIPPRATIRLL